MEYITSKENQTLKRAQALLYKKYRLKESLYLIEGYRHVIDMLPYGVLQVLLFKETIVGRNEMQQLMQDAEAMGIRTYSVSDKLFDNLAETVNGQGVIGIGAKQNHSLTMWRPQGDLYLLLDNVQDPGNMGTIIRTAVAAGVGGIFLTKGCVDPYNGKTVRSAVSALVKVPIYEGLTDEQVVALLKTKGLHTYVTALEHAKDYGVIVYKKPSLLVVGNEGQGVSPAVMQACQTRITIPLYGDMESLNLSVATGICLYKMREQLEG